MKLSKFLSILSSITFFSLFYVYQQTEIVRLAYMRQKKKTIFEDLLDKNASLRYNANKSASVVHIADVVSEYADFRIPDNYHLVRLTPSKGDLRVGVAAAKRENVLSRLFSIKRQAEAKTVSVSNALGADDKR